MKTLMIVAALAGILTTTSAFAQSVNAGTSGTQSATATQDTQVSPYGQPVAQKTRAQVYQELVEAEQDGQLAYLNSTVYAH